MIKIETIQPVDELLKKPLSNLELEFLRRVKLRHGGSINPRDKLHTALNTGVMGSVAMSHGSLERSIVRFLYRYFDQIICANPKTMQSIIDRFNVRGWETAIYSGGLTDFGLEILKLFNYDTKFRTKARKGIWYAKQLNIKSCPYCNGQYTLIVETAESRDLAKFQFDHFFPKKKYPYLSLSMYNLIPSCAPCNLRKSNKYFNIRDYCHPYDSSLAFISKFHLDYPNEVYKMGIDKLQALDRKKLTIIFKSKFTDARPTEIVQRHDQSFDITAQYERHKDIVHELLVKSKLYSGAGATFIMSIEGLFPDRESLMHHILGNYMKEEQMLERPLAKMVQDIAKQLSLI